MRSLNKYHLLLAALVFSAGCFLLVYRFKVKPLRDDRDTKLETVAEKEQRITGKGYPLSLRRLNNRLEKREAELAELEETRKALRRRVRRTFRERLRNNFGRAAVEDPDTFQNYVTRLDYQELYDKVIPDWQEKGVVLADPLLNLRKNTTATNIHLVLLQLWSLDTVLDLMLAEGLMPLRIPASGLAETEEDSGDVVNPDGDVLPEYVSAVRSGGVTQYSVADNGSEKRSLMFEFPVAVTVECRPGELTAFLNKLNRDNRFVSLNYIELKRRLPTEEGADDNILHVEMECSTFYLSQENGKRELPVSSDIAE